MKTQGEKIQKDQEVMSPEEISLKLKTFAHIEFSDKKFSSIEIIEKNINQQIDLFGRGHKYTRVEFDNFFPKYILKNKKKFHKWIL